MPFLSDYIGTVKTLLTGIADTNFVTDAQVTKLDGIDADINVDAWHGRIMAPANGTYVLVLKAPFACTINELAADCGAGSCTVACTIEGTNVTGISALSATTTEASATASAANSVAAGNTVALVLSSVTGMSSSYLDFTLKFTRA